MRRNVRVGVMEADGDSKVSGSGLPSQWRQFYALLFAGPADFPLAYHVVGGLVCLL